MKVVIILCIKAFREDLEKIFKDLNVHAYSETDIRGFKLDIDPEFELANWFGSEENPYDSIASFSFMTEDQAEALLNRVHAYNKTIDCCSPMHAFMMNVEKAVS